MNQLHRCASISTFLGVAAPLIFIAVGGCGGAPAPDRPKTVPVQGTITLKGQPLADASVTFMLPDNSGSAVGRTDAAGHYSLTTFEQGDGAIPGEYGVQVVKYEEPPQEVKDGETPPLKSLIPDKYTAVASSGLKATVADGADNTFDFDLQ
jgi:hypothetical protein